MNIGMTALSDAASYATDPTLVPLLTAALVRAAVEISDEPDTTANHANRLRLAHDVIQSPTGFAQSTFAWATSTDPDLVSEWVATNYEAAQNSMNDVIVDVWDAVAGLD